MKKFYLMFGLMFFSVDLFGAVNCTYGSAASPCYSQTSSTCASGYINVSSPNWLPYYPNTTTNSIGTYRLVCEYV